MDEKNIMENEAALKILTDARNALESIGVHCSLAPLSLPQGMSISLHVAETGIAAVAANVALRGCKPEPQKIPSLRFPPLRGIAPTLVSPAAI